MDILDIAQVQGFAFDNLQNDLHIGFGQDIKMRLENSLAHDTPEHPVFPPKVMAQVAPYFTAYQAEDQAYILVQASNMTKLRKSKDGERDDIYKEVKRTVDTFATLSIFPDKQQAALTMQPLMGRYKIDPDGGIEAQTVATDQWLQDHLANAQMLAAAETLGLTASIAQLKTLNDEVRSLTLAQNDERAQQVTAALKNARTQTEQAYKAFILALNAAAIMAEDDTQYENLIKSINETIKYYRQLAEQRKKKNAALRQAQSEAKQNKPSGGGSSSNGNNQSNQNNSENSGNSENNGGGSEQGGGTNNGDDDVIPGSGGGEVGGGDNQGGGSNNGDDDVIPGGGGSNNGDDDVIPGGGGQG